ncbi:hypothetical protein AB0M95_10875 [Sphaerisporangium sp. NPDC051017]|uniref:hypothetical protein n=1 Tax=Sphaerisporangium sp. NPDC051017 TaxID=3154636 RepID=UPI003446FEF8
MTIAVLEALTFGLAHGGGGGQGGGTPVPARRRPRHLPVRARTARAGVVDRFRTAAARPVVADVPDWQMAAERCQPRGLPGADDGMALADLLDKVPPDLRQASSSPSSRACPTPRPPT